MREAVAVALHVSDRSRVLEVGAGTCEDADEFGRATGATVIAVDLAAEMLEAREWGPALRVRANALQLPLAAHSVDAAFAINLIHVIADRALLLNELRRVLVPGGRVALPLTSHAQLAQRSLNRFFPGLLAIELRRYPTVEAVLELLARAGFAGGQCVDVDLGRVPLGNNYVRRVRSGIISGLDLLPPDEKARGLQALETAPPLVEHRVRSLLLARAM